MTVLQVSKNHRLLKDDAALRSRLGKRVKACRHQLEISQEELACRADLHRTYVADIERGARNLSLSSISKLARALEVSLSALLSESSELQVSLPTGTEVAEILLVEDNPADVELTLRAFQQARIFNPVRVLRTGEEALDFLYCRRKHAWRRHDPGHPQVMLLDLGLPGIGGIEVLRGIRANKRTRRLPVVVLTASHHDVDLIECDRLGVEAYLSKPVEFHRFSRITNKLDLHWALLRRTWN